MKGEGEMISKKVVAAEFARRKVLFHPKENWEDIRLWGLFSWGGISKYIHSGEILTNMKKENKTIWCTPSKEFYHKWVEPLLLNEKEKTE